jgi:hypothetical protein
MEYDFIKKSIAIHGNKFNYSKTRYINSCTKVTIVCDKHGEFTQLPSNHFKHGCGTCGRELNKRNILLKSKCKEEFIAKANKLHGNTYDYSKTLYVTAPKKVIVICKKHGEFNISPNNHLRGKGCPLCGRDRSRVAKLKFFDDYQPEYIKLYGDKYDYSTVVWKGGSRPINVICKIHGEFSILPYVHKNGKGCQNCSNQHSSMSIKWLNLMEIHYSTRIQHAKYMGEFCISGTRYKADGFSKDINTIFEFNGDFWHGNPELYDLGKINPRTGTTFGQLYDETLRKKQIILEKGYNLVEIWERDWKKFINTTIILQKIWKKYIRNENKKNAFIKNQIIA